MAKKKLSAGVINSFIGDNKTPSTEQQTAPAPTTEPQTGEEVKKATFEISASLLRQLRKFAVDRDIKQKEIIDAALRIYMAEH